MLNATTLSVAEQNDQVHITTPHGVVQVIWQDGELVIVARDMVVVTVDGRSARSGATPTVTVTPDEEWPVNLVVVE